MKYLMRFESVTGQDLIDAVNDQDVSEVKKLIKSGVDLNYKQNINNDNDWTALMLACNNYVDDGGSYEEEFDIAKLLIKSGADLNIQDKFGYTALMWALDSKIIKLLLDSGADWKIKSYSGEDFIDGLVSYDVIKNYPEILKEAESRWYVKIKKDSSFFKISNDNIYHITNRTEEIVYLTDMLGSKDLGWVKYSDFRQLTEDEKNNELIILLNTKKYNL